VVAPVVHVSFSSSGGAGSVARTLVSAQLRRGRDAQLLTVIEQTLRTQPMKSPGHTATAALDEYLIKSPRFPSPISLLRDGTPSHIFQEIPAGSIVHLHGTNGAITLNELQKLSKNHRVVWTLHDMNTFTGACHYALACTEYLRSCERCPAVRSVFQESVTRHHTAKAVALSRARDLTLVAPSAWLQEAAGSSSIFADRDVEMIPNPYADVFTMPRFASTHRAQNNPPKALTLGVVAANLSDPLKNVSEAVEVASALNAAGTDTTVHLIGSGGHEFTAPFVKRRGRMDSEDLAAFYADCDVLVVPSLAENSPLVIAEAASQGCPVFARDTGGVASLVASLGMGAVYTEASRLRSLLAGHTRPTAVDRSQLSSRAAELCGPDSVANQYDEVYQR